MRGRSLNTPDQGAPDATNGRMAAQRAERGRSGRPPTLTAGSHRVPATRPYLRWSTPVSQARTTSVRPPTDSVNAPPCGEIWRQRRKPSRRCYRQLSDAAGTRKPLLVTPPHLPRLDHGCARPRSARCALARLDSEGTGAPATDGDRIHLQGRRHARGAARKPHRHHPRAV